MSRKPNNPDRLHLTDCVEFMKAQKQETVDLCFVDPPFNINYNYDSYNDDKSDEEYLSWCREWLLGAYSILKPDGSFWLAIGDEYAAELKVIAKGVGFIPRAWVIWYYTFGVNAVNGFTKSHTHLLYFIKDQKRFTFNADAIKVPSARQLVYRDKRAKSGGRLPDNTWILRPQQVEELGGMPAEHDLWHVPRVAGTFKERDGVHGCQMPELIMERIVLACSDASDVVFDPMFGTATTLAVAKKNGRQTLGCEISETYFNRAAARLAAITYKQG